MDPLLLRTFVSVARHASFSAAAQELGYTQSAVSQQIASLESDLGVRLLHRRPVGPTDAGQRLLDHAQPILLRLDAARADVRRLAGAAPARLRLGVSCLAMAMSRAAIPGPVHTVRVAARDEIASAVAAGELDLGLIDGVCAPSDPLHLPDVGPLHAEPVAEAAVRVVLPGSHPLAERRRLRLAGLADAGWMDAPGVVTPLADLRRLAHADGFRAGWRLEGTDLNTLLALVAAGGGLCLLPEPVLSGRDDLRGIALSEPRLVHRIEIIRGSARG